MAKFLSRYLKAYFTRWWMPLVHYLAVVLLLSVFVATGLFTMAGFPAVLCVILTGLLVAAACGMLAAGLFHYWKKRKLEGLANLVLFVCLFLLPALFFCAVSRLARM